MLNWVKSSAVTIGTIGYILSYESGTGAEMTHEASSSVFGPSGVHLKLAKQNVAGHQKVVFETEDKAGEGYLSGALANFIRMGLVVRLEVSMEVIDLAKLASDANDFMLDGEHKKAFDSFSLVEILNPRDHAAKHQVAQYLIQGIKGHLEPTQSDRRRAARLLTESSWLEMTEHPDEPNHSGRLLKSYNPEVYEALSALVSQHKPFGEDEKVTLQERLFASLKDLPADPY